MSKIIVITSGKGGVGKTTTAINLAAAMKHFGEDVLIIDGNLSTPNVGLHLNSPEVPINLNHVLRGKAEPFEAIYEHESGIKIMPSSLSIEEIFWSTDIVFSAFLISSSDGLYFSDIKYSLKKNNRDIYQGEGGGNGEDG